MNDDEPKKRGRKPITDGTNKVPVCIKIAPDMKAWLDECAAKGAVKAEIFDLALELAKEWIDGNGIVTMPMTLSENRLMDIGQEIANHDNPNA